MVVGDYIAVITHHDARAAGGAPLLHAGDGRHAGDHLLVDLLEAQGALLVGGDVLHALGRIVDGQAGTGLGLRLCGVGGGLWLHHRLGRIRRVGGGRLRVVLADGHHGAALSQIHPHPQHVHRPGRKPRQHRQNHQHHNKPRVALLLAAGVIVGIPGSVFRLAVLPAVVFIIWHGCTPRFKALSAPRAG